ncbi:MAG: arsenic resistance protein [Verrucomicrobiota bacterium]
MKQIDFGNLGSTLLLLAAIGLGAFIGGLFPATGQTLFDAVDPLILILVSLLFFEVRFRDFGKAAGHLKFVGVAWTANFVIIPTIGYGIAWLLLRQQPPFFIGLMIYFMAPCTDWFLGFTRLAKGNTALGTALLPINLISQLLLYPVFLGLFAGTLVNVESGTIYQTLVGWFLFPLIGAVAAHFILAQVLPTEWFTVLIAWVGRLVSVVIALLVLCICAANTNTILDHSAAFGWILVGVFMFFIFTYALSEGLSRVFHFEYPEHALLTMTTAARNAPLMLAVTAAALPDQPLIYAALVIGTLVELPHLTIVKHLLRRSHKSATDLQSGEQV